MVGRRDGAVAQALILSLVVTFVLGPSELEASTSRTAARLSRGGPPPFLVVARALSDYFCPVCYALDHETTPSEHRTSEARAWTPPKAQDEEPKTTLGGEDPSNGAASRGFLETKNPYRFHARWRDFEEGSPLTYFRNRYYDPETGRFTSRDPMGVWFDGMQRGNGYGAFGNNATNRHDALGLDDGDPITLPSGGMFQMENGGSNVGPFTDQGPANRQPGQWVDLPGGGQMWVTPQAPPAPASTSPPPPPPSASPVGAAIATPSEPAPVAAAGDTAPSPSQPAGSAASPTWYQWFNQGVSSFANWVMSTPEPQKAADITAVMNPFGSGPTAPQAIPYNPNQTPEQSDVDLINTLVNRNNTIPGTAAGVLGSGSFGYSTTIILGGLAKFDFGEIQFPVWRNAEASALRCKAQPMQIQAEGLLTQALKLGAQYDPVTKTFVADTVGPAAQILIDQATKLGQGAADLLSTAAKLEAQGNR